MTVFTCGAYTCCGSWHQLPHAAWTDSKRLDDRATRNYSPQVGPAEVGTICQKPLAPEGILRLPSVKGIATSSLFNAVVNRTNLALDAGAAPLLRANHAYSQNATVVMLVTYSGGTQNVVIPGKKFPDHWLVLSSHIKVGANPINMLESIPVYIQIRNRSRTVGETRVNPNYVLKMEGHGSEVVSFDYYSWGGIEQLHKKRIKLSTFLEHFFGYIVIT